ncbi:MAG: DinB family protein [Bacteroidetes bacterium]|nr:DinB family protein [Bacteroidota bacterium]
MTTTDIYITNFEEVRRRSILVWKGLPEEFYHWKSDKEAESFIEVIRHVLACEHLFHSRILHRGINPGFISPWKDRPLGTLEDELKFAAPFRSDFLTMVKSFSAADLDSVEIVGKYATRKLGDYLLRAAYHESVHAGQFLAHMRTLQINRPNIWD